MKKIPPVYLVPVMVVFAFGFGVHGVIQRLNPPPHPYLISYNCRRADGEWITGDAVILVKEGKLTVTELNKARSEIARRNGVQGDVAVRFIYRLER